MTKFFFAESQNYNSLRQAEKLKATTLKQAKIEAGKKSAFYNTTLKIGTELNEEGCLDNCLAFKEQSYSKKWKQNY